MTLNLIKSRLPKLVQELCISRIVSCWCCLGVQAAANDLVLTVFQSRCGQVRMISTATHTSGLEDHKAWKHPHTPPWKLAWYRCWLARSYLKWRKGVAVLNRRVSVPCSYAQCANSRNASRRLMLLYFTTPQLNATITLENALVECDTYDNIEGIP
jgi:hypothetical protein